MRKLIEGLVASICFLKGGVLVSAQKYEISSAISAYDTYQDCAFHQTPTITGKLIPSFQDFNCFFSQFLTAPKRIGCTQQERVSSIERWPLRIRWENPAMPVWQSWSAWVGRKRSVGGTWVKSRWPRLWTIWRLYRWAKVLSQSLPKTL